MMNFRNLISQRTSEIDKNILFFWGVILETYLFTLTKKELKVNNQKFNLQACVALISKIKDVIFHIFSLSSRQNAMFKI